MDCAFSVAMQSDGGGGSASAALARCVDSACVPPLKAAWSTPGFVPGPLYREETALTYDSLNGLSVLYGGQNGTTSGAQAWGWNGTSWTGLGLVPSSDPGTRFAPVLAYDQARARTMCFGGWAKGVNPTYFGDALEWDGQVWTPLVVPAMAPSQRGNAAFAFDKNGRLVIFGGMDDTGPLGDTWLWDTGAGVFTPVVYGTSPHPMSRASAAAAFDEARGVVVLFGGRDPTSTVNAETWTWDGAGWKQQAPTTSPSARSDANMVYDRRRKRVIFFGGHDQNYPTSLASLNDTWEWDGTTWAPIAATSPPGATRTGPGMAYDDGRGKLVLFGGDVLGSPTPDTKVYELTVWANACKTDADCATGFCTDGLCCKKSSCNACYACNVDPGSAGDCAQVTTGTADPRCDGGTCNAMGLCGP
jgi:hypothetical protein